MLELICSVLMTANLGMAAWLMVKGIKAGIEGNRAYDAMANILIK